MVEDFTMHQTCGIIWQRFCSFAQLLQPSWETRSPHPYITHLSKQTAIVSRVDEMAEPRMKLQQPAAQALMLKPKLFQKLLPPLAFPLWDAAPGRAWTAHVQTALRKVYHRIWQQGSYMVAHGDLLRCSCPISTSLLSSQTERLFLLLLIWLSLSMFSYVVAFKVPVISLLLLSFVLFLFLLLLLLLLLLLFSLRMPLLLWMWVMTDLASTELLQFALKLSQARCIGLWRLPEFLVVMNCWCSKGWLLSTNSNYLGKMLVKIDVARC